MRKPKCGQKIVKTVINDVRLAKGDRFAIIVAVCQANRRAARRFCSLNIITRIADKSICSGIMPSRLATSNSGSGCGFLFCTSSPPITTLKYLAISSDSSNGATNGVGLFVTRPNDNPLACSAPSVSATCGNKRCLLPPLRHNTCRTVYAECVPVPRQEYLHQRAVSPSSYAAWRAPREPVSARSINTSAPLPIR